MRTLRLATDSDIPALERLIPLSVRTLQAQQYSPAQMDAALGPVFGVDRQLIRDATYYVVEQDAQIVACGGWSRRQAAFGGDLHRGSQDDELIDPRSDPARIRAFFVHPHFTRQGLARMILTACEHAARAAGFTRAELVATLTGEPFYTAAGYQVLERYEIPLPNGLTLPAIKMTRPLDP
jgi:GNAT superfamily N-acetyltransferase